jgi:tmRNA-binding protein
MNNKITSGGITFPDLNLYYKAIVIKKSIVLIHGKQVHQRNRIKDSEIDSHSSGHLIFDKEPKNI